MILDASMALAWLILRINAVEAVLAKQAFAQVQISGAEVPAIWFPEVANTLLVYERARRLSAIDSVSFLASLELLAISVDVPGPDPLQPAILALGRSSNLSAYHATYLDLAIRHGSVLATFDRKLVEAARKSGVPVFGDPV